MVSTKPLEHGREHSKLLGTNLIEPVSNVHLKYLKWITLNGSVDGTPPMWDGGGSHEFTVLLRHKALDCEVRGEFLEAPIRVEMRRQVLREVLPALDDDRKSEHPLPQ